MPLRGMLDLVELLGHHVGGPKAVVLLHERAADRLPDPPVGIRRETVSPRGVELVDRPHEAEISLLDQVQEIVVRRGILFRDRYHQPQVGQHEGLTGRLVLAAKPANVDQPPRQRFGGSRR